MDIIDTIRDAPLVDLGILFALAVLVIVGVLQGPIRRLFATAGILVAFLFAANLRDAFGDFLGTNWRQFDIDYNHLLAFAILFVVLSVAVSATIQAVYQRIDVSVNHPIVDDILGGLAGVFEGLVLLLLLVILMGSFTLPPEKPGDLSQFRTLQDMLVNQSHIAHWMRDNIAPTFVHVLSPLLPADLKSVYP